MSCVLGMFVCAVCSLGTGQHHGEATGQAHSARLHPFGYLHYLARGADGIFRPAVRPYFPRECDLVFFDDHSQKWEVLYKMVGSGPPFHSGIVFRRQDGSAANAIYPRDMITDHRYPLNHNWEEAALWQPTPEPVEKKLIPR